MRHRRSCVSAAAVAALAALAALAVLTGCSSSRGDASDEGQGVVGDEADEADAATGADAAAPDAASAADAATAEASNRDRLLQTYFDRLKANPDDQQSNGLIGSDLASVCDCWDKLTPSSQATFLTLTARLQGSVLGSDQSPALDHVTALHKLSGGEGETADDPGSCGGGDFNRVIVSMDEPLHAAMVAAHDNEGDEGDDGVFDVADIPPDSSWRDTHDGAGPHDPFDISNETDEGGPRGQAHFFRDPTSEAAGAPLGRLDVEELVDPFALEFDHDYDCVHDSNPMCEYTFYGPLCAPDSPELGIDIYAEKYGNLEPDWRPAGCP
jgi:hypothetical protein